MTISESDRLHSQLSRFEDMFPGYRTEIVEGAIVMSPVKPHHAKTIRAVWNALESQLPEAWDFISDVAVPFDADKPVVVNTGIGKLTVDTAGLPVDPAAG